MLIIELKSIVELFSDALLVISREFDVNGISLKINKIIIKIENN